jgi:hypothetical protein
MMLIGPPAAAPHVQAGRLRALAVAYHKRFSGMPEVPTTAEAGLPGVDAPTWYGIVVPAGTPKAIVDRLNREFVTMLPLLTVLTVKITTVEVGATRYTADNGAAPELGLAHSELRDG